MSWHNSTVFLITHKLRTIEVENMWKVKTIQLQPKIYWFLLKKMYLDCTTIVIAVSYLLIYAWTKQKNFSLTSVNTICKNLLKLFSTVLHLSLFNL